MLDCGLSTHSVLNFLPLFPIPDWKPNKATAWIPKNFSDPQIEGVFFLFIFNICLIVYKFNVVIVYIELIGA